MATAATDSIHVHPELYRETMNNLYSYIANSQHGYLTQNELFYHYRQQHENAEIPCGFLGYSSLLNLLGSDQGLFTIYFHNGIAYIRLTNKLQSNSNLSTQSTSDSHSIGDRIDGHGMGGGVDAKIQGGKHTCPSCKILRGSAKQIPIDYPSVKDTSKNEYYHVWCAVNLGRWSYIDLQYLSEKKKKDIIMELSSRNLLKPYREK